MALPCPKCSRVNPAEAVYCYFDGVALTSQVRTPMNMATQPFLAPFVFPSGRACNNFDELALAIQDDWAATLEALKDGDLAAFLAGIGRADLARAAREAAKSPDLERALDEFLGRLPSKQLQEPKLNVVPQDINLGQLNIGEDRHFELHLRNQGMRLIYGTITCKDVWLSLGDATNAGQKLFQFQHELIVPVHIRGKRLASSPKGVQGRLVIDSNGGKIEVTIRGTTPTRPFPTGVLAGAVSPRQLAEKAKNSPREAAVFFENGSVARWYRDNGWKYPVVGPASSGLGAIQQYFEAHGLAKPPKVSISQNQVALRGRVGQQVQHDLEVSTQENRAVFALAQSNQPWLAVGCPTPKGRSATVCLVIHSVPDRPGETLRARVSVESNGNQRFDVPVALTVEAGAAAAIPVAPVAVTPRRSAVKLEEPAALKVEPIPLAAEPVVATAAPPAPRKAKKRARDDDYDESDRTKGTNWTKHLLPALLILFILGGLAAHDVFVDPDQRQVEGDEPGLLSTDPLLRLMPHRERVEETAKALPNPTMRFGLEMLRKRGRLTYFEHGETNNTCIRVDNVDYIFGNAKEGTWKDNILMQPLGKDRTGRTLDGFTSTWIPQRGQIAVTQHVEVVPGQTSRMLDTCVVRYTLKNLDNRPHNVGLRFLLDTYIGEEDGVPFTLPGKPEMCNTMREFSPPEAVPDFIQALERPNLSDPGTIATVHFKLGDKIEAPTRVKLGAWPNDRLSARNDLLRGEQTRWEVPLLSMQSMTTVKDERGRLGAADSAVVMYWPERTLEPGASRELGFAYGLGSVAGGEGGGKLGLTVGGSLSVNAQFTVTALVANPKAGETVKLDLPEGLSLAEGDATQLVPSLPDDANFKNSPVTWKVRGDRRGSYTIKVTSSTGASQSLTLRISQRNVFD